MLLVGDAVGEAEGDNVGLLFLVGRKDNEGLGDAKVGDSVGVTDGINVSIAINRVRVKSVHDGLISVEIGMDDTMEITKLMTRVIVTHMFCSTSIHTQSSEHVPNKVRLLR